MSTSEENKNDPIFCNTLKFYSVIFIKMVAASTLEISELKI